MPATVEESCQPLLNNLASDCWTFVSVSVEELCQWLVKNHARVCWTIFPATVEQSCGWLLKNYNSEFCRIGPVTCEESCQRLLNNYASDSSTSKCPRGNVFSEITFRDSSYHIKSSHLITIRDKLAGFSIVRFLLKCIYEQIVVYVQRCLSVEACTLQPYRNWSIDLQCKWIDWFLYSASFY